MENKIIRCTKCNEILKSKIVWLELSNTDGQYYEQIPENHISQGGFPFGQKCAQTELNQVKNGRR